MKFSQKMRLYFFYTMVQKSQKWPKTQIKGGSFSRARLNFRRRPILCTTLHRNLNQASNFGGTFDQLFLWIFLYNFHRRCLFTFSIPWCKEVKNDQKLNSRGSCLKKKKTVSRPSTIKLRCNFAMCFFLPRPRFKSNKISKKTIIYTTVCSGDSVWEPCCSVESSCHRTNRKAQISSVSKKFASLICALYTWGYVHTYTFSKRSVLGCPHVSYVNPETPFTQTWIDPGKRASTWKSRPLCSDSPRAQIALLFVCFLCLPESFFSIASRACAPRKECT